MIFLKRITITLIIAMLLLLTLGCVSASDDDVMLASADADVLSSGLEIDESPLEASEGNSEILEDGQTSISFTGTKMSELSSTVSGWQNGNVVCFENDIEQDTSNYVALQKNITIDGNGHEIDLNNVSYAFCIKNANVVLKNLIIKNGYNDQNKTGGGAVYIPSTGSCTLINCTFISNNAFRGGAVYLNSNNPCTMVNCTFVNNGATLYGGAIYSVNELNLENCVFTNNDAGDGVVYIYSGFCNANDCTFTGNTAHQGAAMYTQACSITNCYFEDNAANHNQRICRGGALYINGISQLDNCNFINNHATSSAYDTYGGAVYLKKESNITNCNFISNTAKTSAGALYVPHNNSIVRISNCNFTDNHATGDVGYGGALFGNYSIHVSDCNFHDNTAKRNGGAVYLVLGSSEFRNSVFVNNTSNISGGAIYSFNHINVENCNFTDNNAAEAGGAICSSLDISDCTFINNHAKDGGAIAGPADNSAVNYFNINGVVFENNTADRWGGSVIGYGQIDNAVFMNSNATNYGGAVYLRENPATIGDSALNNCIFNVSSSNIGGAIYGKKDYTVSNSVFINASSNNNGGAMFNGTAYGCYFVNCSSALKSIIDAGDAYDCIFIDCHSKNSIVNGASGNCTIAESPAIYCPDVTINDGETATLQVRILDRNGNDVNGLAVDVAVYSGNVKIDSFTVQSGSSIAMNPEAGSYRIELTSWYAAPASAVLTVNGAKPSPFISAPAVSTKYGVNANIVVNLVKDVSGNVHIKINGKTYNVLITNGVATYTVSGLNYGSYPVVITYDGDNKYAADSISTTFKVNKNYPITSVVARSVVYGEDATVTVNLAKNVPGNVRITVNGVTQKVPITNRVASATFSGLNAKTYDVTVTYGGNANYVSQTKTATLTVSKGTPIVAVDAPDISYGEDATITVSMAQNVPGNVRFTINGVTERAPITQGTATYTASGLRAKAYDVTISYAGNANYNAQTLTASFNVAKAEPILDVSVSSINVGQDATVTVQLANNVNGNVRITVNGETQRIPIANGVASCSFSGLRAGSYDVSVAYAGSTNFNAQTATASFDVTKSSPGLSVAKTTVNGKTVLTASIAEDATGFVNFLVNGNTYKAQITNGVATLTLPDMAPGTYTLKSTYNGNYKYLAETKTRSITIR